MKNYLKFIFLLVVAIIAIPILGQDVPVDPPADPEPAFNWWMIISGVLAVLTTIFGAAVSKVKKKLKQVANVFKEALDVVFVLTDALEDNNVNPEEVAALKAAVSELKTAWKLLWTKG
jgi:purine-cytosine permease-like protein